MAEPKKWRLLTTAPDQLAAEIWKDILLQHGIPAMVNPGDVTSFMGISTFPCRVMVAGGYEKRARDILKSLQPAEEESFDDQEGSITGS
jgi:hypothetical protein